MIRVVKKTYLTTEAKTRKEAKLKKKEKKNRKHAKKELNRVPTIK